MGVVQVFLRDSAVMLANMKTKQCKIDFFDASKIIPWHRDSWSGPNQSGDRE